MFSPRSLAIIGASRRQGTLGRMFLDAVLQLNFQGKIFPVNPKSTQIDGIPCYPDIASLPETPDLAVILIPKEYVLDTIDSLAQIGNRNVIVISAGFRETGKEGMQLENELIAKIQKLNMRMIGPNSMGLFNTDPVISLNATFSPTPPKPGHVAFISQSGALGVAVLELSREFNLGFSVFVSTGNKADIGDVDVLSFAASDPNTKVISLYQESIDHPQEFRKTCRQTVKQKPILVLKAGRTASGLRAASSHTGALASDDTLTDSFLRQCGAIRCQTLTELLNTARSMILQPVPAGKRVAVITNAGGPGILASDSLELSGLELPILSESTVNALREILPVEAGIRNPIDMIASATHETYRDVCRIVEADEHVDILMMIIVKPPVATTPRLIIENLADFLQQTQKPFFCVVMAHSDKDSGEDIFETHSVPLFHYPEEASTVIGNMFTYSKIRNLPDGPSIKTTGIRNRDHLKQAPFAEIMKRLSEYYIQSCPYIVTDDLSSAIKFQQKNKSVAVKVINEGIIHKSDAGLVRLNIKDGDMLSQTYSEFKKKVQPLIDENETIQLLVQKMIPAGVELVLGATVDPLLGPVIMFGIGGIFVELYRDVSFRILPIDHDTAREMIEELKATRLFKGFRNKSPVNTEVLIDNIINFSRMIETYTDIIEMDLNPIIYTYDDEKLIVADARMTLSI
jgi:acetyltransferase